MTDPQKLFVAFDRQTLIARGALRDVARKAKQIADRNATASILIFDESSRPVELDLRGSADDVANRVQEGVSHAARGPGRPKLGVVAREVTLLPRHWEWLSSQPGGASVALRKLVDDARRTNADRDQRREAQDVAYRFMHAMAGDAPDFEEATRALFAADEKQFNALTRKWARDVRDHTRQLAAPVFVS